MKHNKQTTTCIIFCTTCLSQVCAFFIQLICWSLVLVSVFVDIGFLCGFDNVTRRYFQAQPIHCQLHRPHSIRNQHRRCCMYYNYTKLQQLLVNTHCNLLPQPHHTENATYHQTYNNYTVPATTHCTKTSHVLQNSTPNFSGASETAGIPGRCF